MKKSKFLMLFFVICFGTISIFTFSTYKEHKHVTFKETVLYGDPSVTEGLNATLKTNYLDQIYWDTNIKFNKSIEADTQYTFYRKSQFYEWPDPYEGLEMSVDMHYSCYGYISNLTQLDTTECAKLNGLTFYLKDITDYYDFKITCDLPTYYEVGDTATAYNPTEGTGYLTYQRDEEKADTWVLKNYFKIPVLENESYSYFFDIDSYAEVFSISDDHFSLELLNAVTDDICYFTFNPFSTKGQAIDVSLLPDGFGIFALPYEHKGEEKKDTLRTDKLSVAYPLEPTVEIYELQMNEDQTLMFLYTIEEQQLCLTVIEIASMQTLQKQAIADLSESTAPLVHYKEGVILLSNRSNDTLSVYKEAENHTYHLEFTCNYNAEDEFFSRFDFVPQFVYNGEYLAFAGIDEKWRENNNEYCNFLLAIYNKDGLQYIGKYENSLDSGIDNSWHDYSSKANHHDALDIFWD